MYILILLIIPLVALFLYMRLSYGVTRSSTCLVGKTAIITGANSGIGYQTALNLASRGCKIIMADVANMEESRRNIIKYSNNKNILTKFLDLSSFKSIRDFASDINKTEERLDILINNAGIVLSQENRTEDNLHPVMQINYFGPFLLTHLLIDLLKKSIPSRIVFTSSSVAFFHNLTIRNLNFNEKNKWKINKIRIYSNSKFALLLASDIFAEKLSGSGVTSNSIHPGFVSSPIMPKTYSVLNNVIINFIIACYMFVYSKNQWEGSQTLVHVAVSKKLEKITGKYFWDCKPFIKPLKANDREFCQKIWEKTEKLVNLHENEKLQKKGQNETL